MKPSVRSRKILSLLRSRQELTVEEVCQAFQISQATVRRDFVALVEEGKAEKTWGGLRALDANTSAMMPSGLRENIHSAEKQRIAEKAATLCEDGDIIFVDGGTTTLQMARWLATRPLRIVTNSLLVAHEIDRLRSGPRGAEVFLTGGYLYPGSGLLVGPEAIENLKRYRASTAFLSVGGLNEEGATNNHHLVVEIERIMISRATRAVVLADVSKFGRHELVPEFTWQEVHTLITDAAPPEKFRASVGDRLMVAD